MDTPPESKGLFSVGLLCAGAMLLARHAMLVGSTDEGELARWLLAGTLPDRLIESLILGVVASALAHKAPGTLALVFNAVVLTWGAAGLPRPDVGSAWPLALLVGPALAAAVALAASLRPRLLGSVPGVVAAALLGVVGPALLLGGAPAPTWEVEGREVHPSLAQPDAPSLVLVILDGVGAARADTAAMPALAGLARGGTRFTRAIAAAAKREAAIASLFTGELPARTKADGGHTLAEALALEGFATALFGPPGLAPPAGYRVAIQTAGPPEAAVEGAGAWLDAVAGARFLLTVVIRTDAPSAADLQDDVGGAAVAGLRAADRAVSLLLSHLSTQGLDPSTIVAVVGTVEDQAPPSMRQVRLQVPLLIAGPGLSAGRSVHTVVETRALGPTLGRLAGLRADVDLLVGPAGHARFRDATGARGVRQGNWTLWVGGDGQEQLFQVESDPEERSDLAPDRPDRVGALSALLDE